MDIADQLVRSAGDGDVIEVARLLEQGAVVDTPNRDGRTALDRAVEQGHADVVRRLVGAGADLEQRAGEYQESTPLCLAASRGHTAVVGVLLDAGARTGAQGRLGYVPLVLAATTGDEGHPQTVNLLLDRGVDINAVMKHRTALDWAVGFGQEEMVQRLLSRGAVPSSETLAAARERLGRHPGRRRKTERIAVALLAVDVAPGTGQEPGNLA
ncbi:MULTISPECIES: ankyrin repeat domain-containing protein [unclassified Streptomyces]|uniref:ankyrin repeat domain-containing protein n=1 Tax=unclassified Streptomyces TaxID=2593676 RepID=UPI0036C96CC9